MRQAKCQLKAEQTAPRQAEAPTPAPAPAPVSVYVSVAAPFQGPTHHSTRMCKQINKYLKGSATQDTHAPDKKTKKSKRKPKKKKPKTERENRKIDKLQNLYQVPRYGAGAGQEDDDDVEDGQMCKRVRLPRFPIPDARLRSSSQVISEETPRKY